MSEIIYVMECGCHLEKDQLARANNTKYLCPEHRTGIKHKIYTCERCGKKSVVQKMTKHPKYCQECRAIVHLEQCRRRAKRGKPTARDYAIESLHRRTSKKTYNCTNRPQCLVEILAENPNAEFLPCHNCVRHTPDDIMTHLRIHGGDYERRMSA